jgi:hypothetical protein
MSRNPDNRIENQPKDRSHIPDDLVRGQVENAKNLEKDLAVEEEPVQQHLEQPRRRGNRQQK